MAILGSKALSALFAMALLSACAEMPPAAPAGVAPSILQGSTPAHGSSLVGPVDSLELRFSPPARLLELTVTGSDGLIMPMMVTAVGEVARYSIPLSGLEAGAYSVNWRAAAGGTSHSGSFRFTVR